MFLLCAVAAALVVFCGPGWTNNSKAYRIVPEYDRTLDSVLLSLGVGSKDFSSHQNIISSLPDYSRVIMLMPSDIVKNAHSEFIEGHPGRSLTLVPYEYINYKTASISLLSTQRGAILNKRVRNATMPKGSIWAQDLFEAASGPGSSSSILTPGIHKWFLRAEGKDNNGAFMRDNEFIKLLAPYGYNVEQTPIIFKGGNILVDQFKGQRVAFCGGDVVRETIMVMKETTGVSADEAFVISQLKNYLNVDRVVVLGSGKWQPERLFHLDQAMVLLPGGVAAVTKVRMEGYMGEHKDDLEAVEGFLAELRARLWGMGYRIVDMEVTAEDALNYRYYVNGVPYINRATRKREFLMPLYDSKDSEVFKINARSLEALGYRVIPVPTEANERHGGIHCLVNVIS